MFKFQMIKYVGGYDGQWTNKFYDFWLKDLTDRKHNYVNKSIENLISSGDNYINISHTNKIQKLLS